MNIQGFMDYTGQWSSRQMMETHEMYTFKKFLWYYGKGQLYNN